MRETLTKKLATIHTPPSTDKMETTMMAALCACMMYGSDGAARADRGDMSKPANIIFVATL